MAKKLGNTIDALNSINENTEDTSKDVKSLVKQSADERKQKEKDRIAEDKGDKKEGGLAKIIGGSISSPIEKGTSGLLGMLGEGIGLLGGLSILKFVMDPNFQKRFNSFIDGLKEFPEVIEAALGAVTAALAIYGTHKAAKAATAAGKFVSGKMDGDSNYKSADAKAEARAKKLEADNLKASKAQKDLDELIQKQKAQADLEARIRKTSGAPEVRIDPTYDTAKVRTIETPRIPTDPGAVFELPKNARMDASGIKNALPKTPKLNFRTTPEIPSRSFRPTADFGSTYKPPINAMPESERFFKKMNMLNPANQSPKPLDLPKMDLSNVQTSVPRLGAADIGKAIAGVGAVDAVIGGITAVGQETQAAAEKGEKPTDARIRSRTTAEALVGVLDLYDGAMNGIVGLINAGAGTNIPEFRTGRMTSDYLTDKMVSAEKVLGTGQGTNIIDSKLGQAQLTVYEKAGEYYQTAIQSLKDSYATSSSAPASPFAGYAGYGQDQFVSEANRPNVVVQTENHSQIMTAPPMSIQTAPMN